MKRILFALTALVLVIGTVGAGTFAYFSDEAFSKQNSFKAGTLSIDDSKVAESDAITIGNMAPGDVTAPFTITIKNNGNINLGWLGDWQFTGGVNDSVDLKNALYVHYAKMEFLSPSNQNWLDDETQGYEADGSDVFISDGVGHGPYPSWFNTLAGQGLFRVVSLNLFNNNAGMVPDSVYEHAGALKPNYSYRLTVKFGFAPGAGNDYQGLGPVTAKLRVAATQINSAALQAQGVPQASANGLVTWMNNQIADQTED